MANGLFQSQLVSVEFQLPRDIKSSCTVEIFKGKHKTLFFYSSF